MSKASPWGPPDTPPIALPDRSHFLCCENDPDCHSPCASHPWAREQQRAIRDAKRWLQFAQRINITDLKERVAVSPEFNAVERDFILDAINEVTRP